MLRQRRKSDAAEEKEEREEKREWQRRRKRGKDRAAARLGEERKEWALGILAKLIRRSGSSRCAQT
jgi:hypothetical protein